MACEEHLTRTREQLALLIKNVLKATQMTDKTDEVNIEVSFSPQVFNPDRKHTRRRLFFVITACIIPANMNKETNRLPDKEAKADG